MGDGDGDADCKAEMVGVLVLTSFLWAEGTDEDAPERSGVGLVVMDSSELVGATDGVFEDCRIGAVDKEGLAVASFELSLAWVGVVDGVDAD